MQALNGKRSTGSTSPSANVPVEKKVNRTLFQSQVMKFQVIELFDGSGFKVYYAFEKLSRSVSFSFQNLMYETNPVDTKKKRFEYGG